MQVATVVGRLEPVGQRAAGERIMALRQFSTEFAGRTLSIETGKLAQQADGSCLIRYGDTVVLATAVMGKDVREGIDYFPLLVDYEERLYAAGKIKGSRFIKREGRPSDEAILTARIVDRSVRPLFDQTIRNDVQVMLTILSVDQENDPDLVSLWAASCALHMSNIPWKGPLSGMRIGRIDGEWVLNPTYEARTKSDFELFVVGKDDTTVMMELEGNQIPEDVVAEAVRFAQKHWGKVTTLIEEVRAAVGATKIKPDVAELSEEERSAEAYLEQIVRVFAKEKISGIFTLPGKQERETEMTRLTDELGEQLKADNKVTKDLRHRGIELFTDLLDTEARRMTLEEGKRIDGRSPEEIRPLQTEVALLPRTHGSALFGRGETQVLSIVTLGSPGDELVLDTMEETGKKRYMHHYNFPGFSTGEVKPVRSPARREIGHGALAEKAIARVLPEKEQFPYTIRVVSEVLSSNGSTSMASTCGSTLALMDAGVPITDPVAGISIGVIIDPSSGTYRLLTDIQGFEDHAGNMDFKVAGTTKGITAIQLDIKEVPLTNEIVTGALTQAKKARMEILEAMRKAIPEPRKELSPYAPRIYTVRIDPEKIREVIGKGGETINKIIDECGGKDVTKIDIEDDGLVMITSTNSDMAAKAQKWIEDLTKEVKPGEVYEGTVTRIIKDMRDNEVGAIVEILPGQDGMVHVSEISPERVANVSDFLNVGDKVKVVVTEVDKERGRIGLSIKRLTHPQESYPSQPPHDRFRHGGHGGDRRGGFGRGPRPMPHRRRYG